MEAVWAGGADGGSWLLCKPQQQQSNDRYECQIYNEQSGDVRASGEYVIRQLGWDKNHEKAIYSPVSGNPQILRYNSFDGHTIYLDDSLVLLPDGWIISSFGNGHGKKQQYILGEKVGQPIAY